MRIVVIGVSPKADVAHPSTEVFRGLLAALAGRGHSILFLERGDVAAPQSAEDAAAGWCERRVFADAGDLARYRPDMAGSDMLIVGSGLAEEEACAMLARQCALRLAVYYDFDPAATTARLRVTGGEDWLHRFDLVLTSEGGLAPRYLEDRFGLRWVRALPPGVDLAATQAEPAETQWQLGTLADYSPERQPLVERMLVAIARRLPRRKFVLAGVGYPDTIRFPVNLERIERIAPAGRAAFFGAMAWALDTQLERDPAHGWSAGLGLLEPMACRTPVIANPRVGLRSDFVPGTELHLAETTDDVMRALLRPEPYRVELGRMGRAKVRMGHTTHHRAALLEAILADRAARERGWRKPYVTVSI